MRKYAILAVLLAASLAYGQGTIDITVPDKVATGTLVEAKIEDLGERTAAWMALEPLDLEYRTFNGGASLVFASACAKGRVILLVTVVDWDARQLDQERVIVQVGGESPGPGPGPGPGPVPPPGKRKVVILAEGDDSTVYREHQINTLRKYCDPAGHTLKLYDPDQKDASGKTPAWLADYLTLGRQVGLPAMIVIAEDGSTDLATPVKIPPSGTSIPEAKAAGNKLIAQLKELGG